MREVALEIPVVALAVARMVEESIDGKQNLDESRCDNEHQESPDGHAHRRVWTACNDRGVLRGGH